MQILIRSRDTKISFHEWTISSLRVICFLPNLNHASYYCLTNTKSIVLYFDFFKWEETLRLPASYLAFASVSSLSSLCHDFISLLYDGFIIIYRASQACFPPCKSYVLTLHVAPTKVVSSLLSYTSSQCLEPSSSSTDYMGFACVMAFAFGRITFFITHGPLLSHSTLQVMYTLHVRFRNSLVHELRPLNAT